ncbi:MAG: SH3 domain-containing protein [Desulfobacterales bacterium]
MYFRHLRWRRLSFAVVMTAVLLMGALSAQAAQRLAVKAKIANIRSGPGTHFQVLWQVGKYHPIEIINKKGNWYQLKDFEGDIGWIYKKLVKKFSTVITKKEECNIRSGPGTRYRIVFKSERGVPFNVLKQKGNWIKIVHADGDKGWIYRSLVW